MSWGFPSLVLCPVAFCLKEWRFMELFAGEAMVSAELRLSSYAGVSLDVIYGGGAMDMLSPQGMAFLRLLWDFVPHSFISSWEGS